MKRACSAVLWSVATLFACASVFGSWAVDPLTERVAGADLIVVGTLSDIVEQDFSLTYSNREEAGEAYTTHYDRGLIHRPKILKGDLQGSGYARVAFAGKGQDQHPFAHMLITHSSGEEGVWLLTKDRVLTGYYFVSGPQNPLPLDAEAEVVAALQSAGAAD